MPLFRKNKKVESPQKDLNSDFLKEYASSDGVSLYNFIQGINKLDSNYVNNDALIERMSQDSIIASAMDMWTEDALQKDPLTKEIFNVEVDTPDDKFEAELSNGLALELNRFLKDDLRMDKELSSILKRILKYGNCPVKLDYSDALSDEKLELKESNLALFANISDKSSELFGDTSEDSSKSIQHQYAIDDRINRLDESELYKVDWESFSNDVVSLDNKDLKRLTESISGNLNEEQLLDYKKMIRGRWYIQELGHGTNIYELKSKQKLVAFMDRDTPNAYIKPDRIINFTNNTGKHKVTFEVGESQKEISSKKYFTLERGESFLENSMVAWQVLTALEDILLLTRMTRSILYRIFSVEVGNKGNKETKDLLQRLKNKVKMDETVDVRSKIYNSSLSQVPLGDSIFIPTRNGTGVINVQTVGGDVNLHDAVDLDYFKDKLFAGLRIPAPFLGFTESLPGGIGDTSLTRMDIRYSRTITRIQTILSEGLKDICLLYLKLTRTKQAFEELPDFKISFTSINSSEDASRADLKQTQMNTLKTVLDTLKGLGVDIASKSEGYEKTRQQLIKEYFGSKLLESIIKDEQAMPVTQPEEGDTDNLSDDSLDIPPSNDIVSGPNISSNLDTSDNSDENNTDTGDENNTDTDIDTGIDLDTSDISDTDNTRDIG